MATQQARHQPQSQKPQRRKGLPLGQWIIILIIILTIIAFGIAAYLIVKNQGSTQGLTTLTIITIVCGLIVALLALMFAIFQWLYPRTSSVPEPSVTTSTPPSPPPSLPDKTSYHGIIGLPPPTDPKTIEQRHKVVKEVYERLTQPGITAIALAGIGGIGKSTLAALIYRYAEEQQQLCNGLFTAEPLWLTVTPAVTMADLAGTLAEALGKPMLDLGTLLPQNQAATLYNALNTVDKPRLIVMDQFENFLDWQTGQALPDRVGVGEWLDALNSQPCRCRVLLTSRPDPQGTREYPPTCLQKYKVGHLDQAEGAELLRKRGVTGTEKELGIAVERCAGHALSLTLLASLLQRRNLTLAIALTDQAYTGLWHGDIAYNLLDFIFTEQLNQLQRKLLVAFSIYREPMPLEAPQAIIAGTTKVSKAQVESALDALLAQHILQALGGGRYQLHVIVARYAQDHVVEGDEQVNQQALKAAHARAAQYYLQQAATSCLPREQRRQISDVHDLLEAIWQYCQAEQWEAAYNMMEQEGIFSDLNRWGGNTILLELYLLLLPDKWHPKPSQAALIYNNLGEVYHALSKLREALTVWEQSLLLYREAGDRKGEGEVLHNLGVLYHFLGNTEQALSYYQQALSIHREVGNRKGEGEMLHNLGVLYRSLGNTEQALSYYQQALNITREVGNRYGEGYTLWNIGAFYFKQTRYNVALACFLLAKGIFEEVQSPSRDKVQGRIDGLHQKVGEAQFATLLAQVEPQAQQIVEQALPDGLGH
jgi:tetratricopeptide (TPR) repeat protein